MALQTKKLGAPRIVLLVAALLYSGPALADGPALHGRPFGTDEDPPPGVAPSGPHVVMRLTYAPIEGCPDEHVLRAAVSAQVRRWDPFAPNAPWHLTVAIARRGPGYEGSAELRDVTGAVVWQRPFAPRMRCFDLVEDLAVTLALKINPPLPPVAEQKQKPTAPDPEPIESTIPLRAATLPAPPSRVVSLRISAGTWLDLATSPRPVLGLTADIGFRVAWVSVDGEIRWDPPAGATVMDTGGGVDVSTTRILAGLVPCVHVKWFIGCLVGEIGQIRGSLTSMREVLPDHQAMLYGTAGARLGAEIPIVGERLFVRVAANLLGVPKRPAFRLSTNGAALQTEWESPALTGGLGAGLLAAF